MLFFFGGDGIEVLPGDGLYCCNPITKITRKLLLASMSMLTVPICFPACAILLRGLIGKNVSGSMSPIEYPLCSQHKSLYVILSRQYLS